MERTFTARSPGRLGLSTGLPLELAGRLGDLLRAGWSGLPGALSLLPAGRRGRIALVCAVLALPVLGGGWLWFRQSSFVAVRQVRIEGVHGAQAAQIEAALREAAKGMSTLDANGAALHEAVGRFPAVAALSVRTSFPHGLRIVVTEQPPVAALIVAGVRNAVSASGVVLGPAALSSSSLPLLADNVTPAVGERVHNPLVLDALTVLGAAPAALDHLAARIYYGSHGLTVRMRNGLQVYFGDASRSRAKWMSMARVLADRTSAGAVYVDVRLPERPAAGFAEDGLPTGAEASAAGSRERGESAVSALAAGLSVGSPEPGQSSGETQTQPSGETSTESSGETQSDTSAETAAQPGGEAGAQASGEDTHSEARSSSSEAPVAAESGG